MSPAPAAQVAVSNTKLAACLIALGFKFKADLIQSSKAGAKLHTQFLFSGPSLRPQYQHIALDCAQLWEKGQLDTQQPMHPLCVMMRGQHNYDRLMDWQMRGTTHHLRSTAAGQMLIYRPGPVKDWLTVEHHTTPDLALCAALAGCGIPVTRITGSVGAHLYTFPCVGFSLLRPDGSHVLAGSDHLTRRAPTPTDPRRLHLEDTDPLHPMVQVYDALNCRAHLKRALLSTKPLLLIEEEGTTRQALLSMNSTGRVMQRVEAHFKSPPIPWTQP
jgi:hypothetical protein